MDHTNISWSQVGADTYIPDAERPSAALARTTHLAVGAHQDDLEIMAIDGIVSCYRQREQFFTGVVVCDGSGSPRVGPFAEYSDVQMRQIRRTEQKNAADLGEYGALIQLDFASTTVKDPLEHAELHCDLINLISQARPRIIYTHSLFDNHATHRAVALAVILALRRLGPSYCPEQMVGCEVWQDLDWLPAPHKITMDLSRERQLQQKLLALFESQVAGGKRYDLGAMGRRLAHATFAQSHVVDQATGIVYGMDLLPLVLDQKLAPADYISGLCEDFRQLSVAQLASLGGGIE